MKIIAVVCGTRQIYDNYVANNPPGEGEEYLFAAEPKHLEGKLVDDYISKWVPEHTSPDYFFRTLTVARHRVAVTKAHREHSDAQVPRGTQDKEDSQPTRDSHQEAEQ